MGALVAAAILLLPASALAGDGTFPTQPAGSPFAAATHPFAVAIGDFNSDGDEDLAVANLDSNNVTVRLGAGDGTFATQPAGSPFAAGAGPISVAVGDFNSDGNEDLAIANEHSNNVTVRLGAGDGTFATQPAASPFAAGTDPDSVAVGDFNSDGNEDLAIANAGSNNVTVRLGAGDGTFPTQPAGSPYATGAFSFPISVAVGDFNSDGNEDLAIANDGSGNVTVRLGAGDGTFATQPPASPFAAGRDPFSVAVGDFNSDGDEDLAVANAGSNDVTVRLGAGDGSFPIQPAGSPFAAGTKPRAVAIGDFNSDGNEDLAVANDVSNNVTIRLGTGDGTFASQPVGSPFAAGAGPTSVAVGNFSSDGDEDLAIANIEADNVTVRRGAGTPLLAGNLLSNGGIEGSGAARKIDQAPGLRDGWSRTSGRFTYARYGMTGGPPPLFAAARWEGGENAFWGGPTNTNSSATQTVDVSADAPSIDEGLATADLAADLGGRGTQNDRMAATARFLDSGGNQLGSFAIGPVTAAERTNRTVLLRRSQSAAIPTSTRKIQVGLDATWATGSTNDAYADNVKLTLHAALPVPENASPPVILDGANPAVGTRLLSQVGIWKRFGQPITFNRQWLRCDASGEACVEIAGETNKAYTPTLADVGHTLRHRVIAQNAVGQSPPAVSAPTGVVAQPVPVNTSPAPTCHGEHATIVGTASDDVLNGTEANDVIVAFGGDDQIFQGAGDDLVCAGAGDDIVTAGAGADRIYGGDGVDRLRGEGGNDGVRGGAGPDLIWGGNGADVLRGQLGTDVLRGKDGADVLRGGPKVDTLHGGKGDDVLVGRAGNDHCFGGSGDNALRFC